MNEKRKSRRIIANELIYDINSNFLGVCLDVTYSGIRLTVAKNFPDYDSLSIQLKPPMEEKFIEVALKIQPLWRQGYKSVYDEIGAKIIQVEQEKEWQELLRRYVEDEVTIRELCFISIKDICDPL